MGIYDFLMKYNLTYEQYIEMLYEIRSFLDFSDTTMEMLVKLSDSLYDDKEFNEIKPLYKKEDKIFNHSIKSDDTAKDLAFVICDIYANEEKEQRALDTILNLCKQL